MDPTEAKVAEAAAARELKIDWLKLQSKNWKKEGSQVNQSLLKVQ